MDLLNVIILIPSTGKRMILDNVEVEIEMQQETYDHTTPYGGVDHQMIKSTHLDIVLSIYNTTHEMYERVKQELFNNEEFFLYFKDVHPNLIKAILCDVTIDQHKTTFEIRGNTTDKEYLDYIAEVTNQFNYQYHWKSNTTDKSQPIQSSTIVSNKKKDMVLKRKLTF